MTRLVRFVGRVSLLALVLTGFGLTAGVRAQPSTTRPAVTLDRGSVVPGGHVVLTFTGFTQQLVTISVCGNEGRRGSSDCNMAASQTVELHTDGTPTTAEVPVLAPPVACPCVVRVSSRLNDEVAFASIVLIGHPIEPVVAGPSHDQPLVEVSISARAVPHGLLRWIVSNLGGSVPYEVAVTVKNVTTEPISNLTVFGSLGRNADDELATLPLKAPAQLGPGQTWKQVVSAKVPAPSVSSIEWRAVVSRAGPRVSATVVTRHRPVLLLVVASLLVIDLTFLVIRRRMRRRATREAVVAAL